VLRKQPVVECGPRIAHMQHAGRGGRKAHPWFSLKLRISHLESMLEHFS
jgi:hypothetical protein